MPLEKTAQTPKLQPFLTALTFLLIFFVTARTPQDADMWWHLRAGQEMVEHRTILTTDVFSYTRYGEKWTNAFWISDISMYLLYKAGGYLALALAVSLLAVATMTLVYRQSEGPFPLRMGLLLLSSFAIAPVWGPRPQILSFLLLAILDSGISRPNGFLRLQPWWLVPVFILWANVHGGFIWGFLLLAAYMIGEGLDQFLKGASTLSLRQLGNVAAWTIAAAAAVLINPNGISLWKLPFYTVDVSIRYISEWASPDFHRLDLHPVLWLVFLLIVGAGTSGKIVRWSDLLKVIGFAYMAFVSQRSIGPFVVVAAPVTIRALSLAWEEQSAAMKRRFPGAFEQQTAKPLSPVIIKSLNTIILATLTAGTLLRAYLISTPEQVNAGLPQDAVSWIRSNHPGGRMFNSYNWGGYLLWNLPEYPVFIDGRADLYSEDIINTWWRIVNGTPEGFSDLAKWKVDFILLEPDWPLIQKLSAAGWKLLYQDSTAVIYGRP